MPAVVCRDDADIVHGFVKQGHRFFVLDDLHRVESGGLIESAWNAGQVTTRLGIFKPSLQAIQSFRLRLWCVFVARRRRTAAGRRAASGPSGATAASSARSKVCSIERTDEKALKPA